MDGFRNSGFPIKEYSDLFSRRFREGISFPNFVEKCIPELPLSKLCSVPISLQNRALFERGEKGEKVPRKGEEEGWPAKGAKRKKGRAKTGQYYNVKKKDNPRTLREIHSGDPEWQMRVFLADKSRTHLQTIVGQSDTFSAVKKVVGRSRQRPQGHQGLRPQ